MTVLGWSNIILEWSPSTLGLNFVGWGGIWSFRFLIYCFFLLVPVSLVRTSCWLKGKLFLKKFSFLLALAVDYSINASVHTQLSCVWVGTVWLQEFTYLLDRLDLSNVLHLVWSKCVSLTHLKIRLISISGALLGQKKNHKENQQSKETATANICPVWMHEKLNKIHVMAFLTGGQRATPHKEDKLLLFSSYKQPAALNCQRILRRNLSG